MPLSKDTFVISKNNLTKEIDVDDSAGRSVPQNMNFVEESYLIKDTGYIPAGLATDDLAHSLFNYQKKNGDSYLIRALATKLQRFSFPDRQWVDIASSPTFTTAAQFGYAVYGDVLHLGNAVESLYTWNGTTFTAYASAPKGNILEIFEDRLWIAGVIAEPLTTYYSNVGIPTTYSAADVVTLLGTDAVVGLTNYYGTLLLFKLNSIWKLTFVYNQITNLFVPKPELQSSNYGACSRQAMTWVENDVWFFTGKEVRSIGYKDQQIGILGVNNSVISDSLKETLSKVKTSNYGQVVVFYENRRFYLSVIEASATTGTTFVCHLLYQNNWTKYINRDKGKIGSAAVLDGIIYTSNAFASYGVIKWTVEPADAVAQNLIRVAIY